MVAFSQEEVRPVPVGTRPKIVNVRARVYSDAGAPLGDDFLVDSQTGDVSVQGPSAILPTATGFVVQWSGSNTAGFNGIQADTETRLWARSFDRTGAPLGPDFAIGNSKTVFHSEAVPLERRSC